MSESQSVTTTTTTTTAPPVPVSVPMPTPAPEGAPEGVESSAAAAAVAPPAPTPAPVTEYGDVPTTKTTTAEPTPVPAPAPAPAPASASASAPEEVETSQTTAQPAPTTSSEVTETSTTPAQPAATPAPEATETATPAATAPAEKNVETETTAAPSAEAQPTATTEATEATTKSSAPEKTEAPASTAPETTPKAPEPVTPLQDLWVTAKAHEHPEIWGVTLADPSTHIPTQIVLQKYLNANDGDVAKAKDQLTKTLDWRKKMQPLELIKQSFSREKFGTLGYVTTYASGDSKEIFTWNVYGNVKSIDVSFGALDEFIKWRVALMELAVQELSLATATEPITSDPDADPYKMFQVHDYKGVSFLRQAPQVKTASTETIRVFATAYPELLKEKFFVNVPAVMGFMYSFMKLFVAARTIKKFHPLPNGANLAKENFGGSKLSLTELLPSEYGGKGTELKTQGTAPLVE
ncbi:CRAL-TRIO domain-containing protein [Xylaria sp. CBS 124048]|nr:CRAL-TRIO domain-containing protein [Xylaria sp. CBS 124048]